MSMKQIMESLETKIFTSIEDKLRNRLLRTLYGYEVNDIIESVYNDGIPFTNANVKKIVDCVNTILGNHGHKFRITSDELLPTPESKEVLESSDDSYLTVERNQYGAWVVSDIIDDYLVSKQYYDYTKKEAIEAFKEEFKEEYLKKEVVESDYGYSDKNPKIDLFVDGVYKASTNYAKTIKQAVEKFIEKNPGYADKKVTGSIVKESVSEGSTMTKKECAKKLRDAIVLLVEAQEYFADKPRIYQETEECRYTLQDLADQLD